MLKKSFAFGLLAAAAIGSAFTPAAHANEVQVNKQDATQNAVAIGQGNSVHQNLDQSSFQHQVGFPGYPGYGHPADPQVQVSAQEATQNAAAVGQGNSVYQNLDQSNWQNQFKF